MSIKFRCWYCHRRYTVEERRIGDVIACSCKNDIRIPKRDNGSCKIKSPLDWVLERILCGGGGAVIGIVLALVFVAPLRGFAPYFGTIGLVALLGGIGFLVGILGGVHGLDWIGQTIRERQNG